MKRWIAPALVALLVSACATPPARRVGDADLLAAQAAREAALSDSKNWSLVGRLSVSANGEGGNGRIDWHQRGDDYEIRLSAPVTRKSWTLVYRDGRAMLDGLDGGVRTGTNAEALLFEATGWRIPLAALADWARGARASGPATIEFNADGLPEMIAQQGWQVEYREWEPSLLAKPRRVFARQGDATVRLVVDSWGEP